MRDLSRIVWRTFRSASERLPPISRWISAAVTQSLRSKIGTRSTRFSSADFMFNPRLCSSYALPNSRAIGSGASVATTRSEEHTSELQSLRHLVCRLLLEKKKQLDHKLLV